MREVRARFPVGVTVVTTSTEEGLHGLTVSSFATVSLRPPLVLVCIEQGTQSEALIAKAGAFGVSVLAEPQEFLSERFAGHAPLVDANFSGVPYHIRATGAPLLDGAIAWFDCRVHATYNGGDHAIFVGRVVAAEEGEGAPLLYYGREYHTLGHG